MKPLSIRLLALLVTCSGASTLHAQYPGVQGTVERQIQALEQKKQYAAGQIAKGDAAMDGMDYESAFAYYKSAVDALPQAGAASADVRNRALNGFCSATVQLARQRVSEGRYADARTTVEVVLEERYNPNYAPALTLRSQLLDPQGFVDRGTLTPSHVSKIEEVKKLIQEGEGFFASGRYDLAFKRCEQALNVDKYNIAARRLMEKINAARQQYANAAYNETRSDMLMQVAKAWELPVRKFTDGPTAILEQPEITGRSSQAINDKLNSIIIPKIALTDSTIREALVWLQKEAAKQDPGEDGQKGINIVLKLAPGSIEESAQITLELNNAPLRDALEFITQAAGMKVKVDPYAVVVVPQSENTDVLITKEYKVPPGFIQSAPGGQGASSGQAGISKARAYFEEQGVTFPEGALANYSPSTSRLLVKNTQANLDIIESLVMSSMENKPTQVEIETKFLEVSQNNVNELGFDWLIGQFALPGGSGVYGSGGTPGFGRTINNSAYPLVNPGSGLPVGASSSTSGPITAGNRGGSGSGYSSALSLNAVDALLFAGGATPAGVGPGILSVAGVFTNPQFQVVLRALSQKKGIDLVSAPKVTAQSGRSAIIEIIRQFRYPDPASISPPVLSPAVGSQFQPIVPSTPTAFVVKPTGITLEVEPTVGPDLYTIELRLEPRVIEFDGFINYGSPINATVANSSLLGTVGATIGLLPSRTFEATPNTINQPVFSSREVRTEVSVYDGETVVMGGLMREDVQKVQDKVPILGDIPLAGRLFRSSVDQHIKRNLIMFVTASLMDPAGQPIIQVDEEETLIPDVNVQGVINEAIPGDILSVPLPQ
jgi:general secretion pathway protein D